MGALGRDGRRGELAGRISCLCNSFLTANNVLEDLHAKCWLVVKEPGNSHIRVLSWLNAPEKRLLKRYEKDLSEQFIVVSVANSGM